MAPRACRTSAPSAKWRAPPWCAAPSRRCAISPPAFCASPTTWTACARFRRTCPTARSWSPTCTCRSPRCPIPSAADYRELRRSQQRHAAALPRHLRLRLRIRQRHRVLQVRPFDDDAAARRSRRFDDIMAVMLPTLGEERQATYCPFLPISPITGRVLYVPMKEVNAKAGTITFADEDGTRRDHAGDRRPHQAAVEARLRHALGRARRRLRDVRQGPPDQRADL